MGRRGDKKRTNEMKTRIIQANKLKIIQKPLRILDDRKFYRFKPDSDYEIPNYSCVNATTNNSFDLFEALSVHDLKKRETRNYLINVCDLEVFQDLLYFCSSCYMQMRGDKRSTS